MSITMKVEGMKKWLDTLKKEKEDMQKLASEKSFAVAAKAQADWQSKIETVSVAGHVGVIDIGTYIQSIVLIKNAESRGKIIEHHVKSTDPKAIFVEYGTSPHFPPPGVLDKWVQRKLLRFGTPGGVRFSRSPTKKAKQLSDIKSVAFLVGRKMKEGKMGKDWKGKESKYGTVPHPCFEPAAENAKRNFEKIIAEWKK